MARLGAVVPGMLACIAGSTGCAPASRPQDDSPRVSEIVSGVPDDHDPAVVGLISDGDVTCTGTLVAPRLVLTAAHCVTAHLTGVAVGVAPATANPIVYSRVHPRFDPSLARDLAVLVLRDPVDLPAPPLWPTSVEPPAPGAPLRIVGFGHADDAPAAKQTGTAVIGELSELAFAIEPAPARPCHGDSGGAVFADLEGREHLLGVISRGDAGCTLWSQAVRVDAFVDDFVAPALAELATGSQQLGDQCFFETNCATGACVTARDGPLRFCSSPCAGAGDCPPALECASTAAGTYCVHPLPSPGALGADCASDIECAGGLCLAAGGGPGDERCSERCFPDNEQPCSAAGFACRTYGEGDGKFACVPEAAGGCDARGGGPGPGALALAIAWLAGTSARRRRPR